MSSVFSQLGPGETLIFELSTDLAPLNLTSCIPETRGGRRLDAGNWERGCTVADTPLVAWPASEGSESGEGSSSHSSSESGGPSQGGRYTTFS